MRRITDAVMAVYNFFVGDPVILAGVAVTFVVVGLIARLNALSTARPALGGVVIAGVLASLALSLRRETRPKR